MTTAERVREGANFLDKHADVIGGDWRKKIDPETLDVGECHLCILGQLFTGDYNEFLSDEGFFYDDPYQYGKDVLELQGDDPRDLAFDVDGDGESYEDLNEAWKEVLAA